MKFVLWTRSRSRWVPTLRSRDAVELTAIAAACTVDGLGVVVLPEGAVPCDA